MKKLAFALCSALLVLGACTSSVTAPQRDRPASHNAATDTASVTGGHGMGSGN
ncbi:MAG TPA: hypothetical protein VF613_05550 [Longimicrobium sp.]|jgi:hypothetical protein